ncbi:MAG: hypothetical protein LAO79_17345 [Acidobacteriia bacterium]|nr:hypothetical protein [Terriglobia bacterium]
MMDKCLDCNSTLKDDELVCYTCGSARRQKNPKPTMAQRGALIVKVLFVISGLFTVASLFLPATPSFTKCLATTIILMFVNRSAEQMVEKQKG